MTQTMATNKRGKTGIVSYGIYRYYRSLLKLRGYKDKRSEFNVSFAKFSEVIQLFNMKARNALIYESWVFKLPYRLGTIYIRRIPMNIRLDSNGELYRHNLKPDWHRTKKLWKEMYPDLTKEEIKQIPNKKIVYFTNEHTGRYKFRIHWEKKYCNIPGHGPYEFVFTRENKRLLAEVLKTNPNITYYE
jgi:hypothetical protein